MSRPAPSRRARASATQPLQWLAHHPQAASLLHVARELLALENDMMPVLPRTLGRHVRVASLEGGMLALRASGPAQAARLRQITPAIVRQLQSREWPVTDIMIRIDASMGAGVAQKARRETRPLDGQALGLFEALQEKVSPGPLSEAIARLLAHHR
ncbi:DciA family protein [Castellaniella sp.]|uniref:DciA family protein n=1 Tax=Castellaniella sp. TaxID=1955812 RepID=UPI00355EEC0A